MTQRRDFIRKASLLAAGSLAAGAVEAQSAALSGKAGAAGTTGLRPAAAPWDMSWVDRVTGKYRMAFDAPEISEGAALHQVRAFLAGYNTVYGTTDADLSAVLVIRHKAVPMVLGDALWADGAFAGDEKLQDPETGEPAKRNPFTNVPAGARFALTWPDGALDRLLARGVIVLACDMALNGLTGRIAGRKGISREDAAALVAQHLIPGVIRMPTGIFATCRAQAAGCGVMYAV
ncbi:MAG: hypothetical protein OEW77_11270 [Gemmatimonadota bacterium]|nr:hypothetical protein [Gemmatimonadota bacterium]